MSFTSSDRDHKICKLYDLFFRLMQASQSWIDVIKQFDFIKNKEDP